MKFLIIIFALISVNGCAQSDNTEIIYHAETRGFYYHLEVNKNHATLQKIRGSEKGQTLKLEASEWVKIKSLLEKIDVAQMENLKSDRSKSQVDAAAMATLKVKLAEDNIHSCDFDHGYPPDELEQLVKAMLSLAKTVEKQ